MSLRAGIQSGMDVTEALLESWDRQCRIVEAVVSLIAGANRHVKPWEGGMPLHGNLAHMHIPRKFGLSQVAPGRAASLGRAYADNQRTPIADLDAIKGYLKARGEAVGAAVREGLAKGGR